MGTFIEQNADLPLFNIQQIKAESARRWHERDEAQVNVLQMLRGGERLTKREYERSARDGTRLAPVIEQLRNAHGFTIEGDGSVAKPHFMPDVRELPSLARVTPDMKLAYYTTLHWQKVREERFSRDAWRCVLCSLGDELRCHHVSYLNLFCEPMRDLMTLCDECHDRVHKNCRLKFPSGISLQYAHLLEWRSFEPWLLP